jgi:hypothetical protein
MEDIEWRLNHHAPSGSLLKVASSSVAKKVGDPVKVGDLLFTYENDKATLMKRQKRTCPAGCHF